MANDGERDDDDDDDCSRCAENEDDDDDIGGYDYEVMFTEDKLGLTLRSQGDVGDHVTRTVVKSANGVAQLSNQIHEGDVLLSVNDVSVVNLHFADVLCVLKVSSRPIRLRFRAVAPPQRQLSFDLPLHVARADASGSASRAVPSPGQSGAAIVSLDAFLLPEEPEDEADRAGDSDSDNDDADSRHAVHSESFGDADSTRTTENSSVVTDLTEFDFRALRHSSRFAAFLRKPFRRADGFDHGSRVELRLSIIPAAPRLEVSLESPNKAAVRVFWRGHPKALAYHVQYSRDRAMKVWKNWSGRVRRRSSETRLDLVTLLYGLDHGKSYVARVRFEFDQSYSPGEWSALSAPVLTPEPRGHSRVGDAAGFASATAAAVPVAPGGASASTAARSRRL
ncbi:hypothetical protein PybrP1_009879 [[Pythium] brassicae (nom. inval.)]|nr:hypothetical protein PybrP1_009879 [[Pythium] brassicae (nom. inval.)]